MSTPIPGLQPQDRPRERLLERGVDVLSERELLALVLRDGRKGESALDLASSLLQAFGGLQELSKALPEELTRLGGVGPAKASALVAAFRIGKLTACKTRRPVRLKGLSDVADVARPYVEDARRERLVAVVCDSANRLVRVERITEGSIDRAMVPVREILNAVLRHDGRAFALAHNHPSGELSPSWEDHNASAAVSRAAAIAGLRFLGHVVVSEGTWRAVNPDS